MLLNPIFNNIFIPKNDIEQLKEIKHITAIQISEQKKTNSVPFLVLCDDGELYYAKTIFKTHPPYEDVINEILSVYFLELMGVQTISPALIKIPQDVFDSFKLEKKFCDKRYDRLKFDDIYFFGSLVRYSATELDSYNTVFKNKHDYNKFINPIDLLKIGVFDFWICNKDRRGSNPNILIDETVNGKFEILPIDHTQAFAYQSNYKALRIELMDSSHSKSLLRTPMSKSILKFADSNYIATLDKEIQGGFNNVISNIEFVFDQVPREFGLSKKGKEKIKEILSNKERNETMSKIHLSILR